MIIVFGAGGMLGKAVVSELEKQEKTYKGLTHQDCNILNVVRLQEVNRQYEPEVIINCAGTPKKGSYANSLGPWYIARVFNSRIIHVSTDCVFDNMRRINTVRDIPMLIAPNAVSDYQVSKMLGEQHFYNVINVRTSFIGYDHGLLKWLLEQKPRSVIQGWDNAFWSGSTVYEVARHLVALTNINRKYKNVEHLATEKSTTKYDVLCRLVTAFDLPLTVERTSYPAVLRGLDPTITMSGLDSTFIVNELVQARPVPDRVLEWAR